MEKQTQTDYRMNTIIPCPVCSTTNVQPVLEIPQIPILANVLWDNRADALAARRGDMQLTFCETCGHVFNRAFDPALMEYDVHYENSLHFSPRFQQYADWLARYLIARYGLNGKKIIEIGSGKGEFLRMLCEFGQNTGVGFDPSYAAAAEESHPALSFVKDIYSERYSRYQADLVLSRHVLEHIYRPAEFVQSLRHTIGAGNQTVVFCEVPNFGYILRDTALWDLIYEHVSYFSANSLKQLFASNGFNILNLSDAFEGQFLYIEAEPGQSSPPANGSKLLPLHDLAAQVERFANNSQVKLTRWKDQLNSLREHGKRAVLWGAGSKGISFLNMLHVENEIEYIVDINPRKHGKFVTGAGQQIVSPEFLADYRPDTIIVMNPIYREEIQGMAGKIGLHVDLLTAT